MLQILNLEVNKKCFCNRCNIHAKQYGGESNEKYYV
ncbi:hypothetical protein C248_2638 [Staphylococcus aureus 08BA02176]|nr:hypothetical protein C248_2638 [Staphylococcus aureus 08BA02176]